MIKKLIYSLFFVAIIVGITMLAHNFSLADEIRQANNSNYWLYLSTEMNDSNFDIDPEWNGISYHYNITLKDSNGNPVNETFHCTGMRYNT